MYIDAVRVEANGEIKKHISECIMGWAMHGTQVWEPGWCKEGDRQQRQDLPKTAVLVGGSQEARRIRSTVCGSGRRQWAASGKPDGHGDVPAAALPLRHRAPRCARPRQRVVAVHIAILEPDSLRHQGSSIQSLSTRSLSPQILVHPPHSLSIPF